MAMERKADFKLRQYLELEKSIQKKWNEEKIFEEDAPKRDKKGHKAGKHHHKAKRDKYVATFPFPYMNGKLHLGHSFSLSKCEVSN